MAGAREMRLWWAVVAWAAAAEAGGGGGLVFLKGQGLVRGTREGAGGDEYWQYKGIPYATATPRDRFESPLPVPRWTGIREANEDVACPQVGEENRVVGREDCLVVNVYAPVRARGLPVMVFIHGGSYYEGSAERAIYGPERFVGRGVILVTLNYRLGVLGFLCTGRVANAGLKDAVAALEWVRDNIASFGGDPRRVTAFGQSAGSAMVELLVLSHRTRGLFAGAIYQSGLATSPWAFGSDPEEKARRVATELGYDGTDAEERLRVLKNASLEDLTRATLGLVLMTPNEFVPITPCTEPADRTGAVVTLDPSVATRAPNDVPVMLGFTKDEAMLLYGVIQEYPDFFEKLNDQFEFSLPKDLQGLNVTSQIVEETKRFYFGDRNISSDSMSDAIRYYTDVTYAYESVRAVRRYVRSGRRSPVYLYEFAYDGGMPFLKIRMNITDVPGVCHADELGYMFTQTGYNLTRPLDLVVADRLLTMWTNFAKFGDPTPERCGPGTKWSASSERLEYLLIDEELTLRHKPKPERTDYWDSIYRKYTT